MALSSMRVAPSAFPHQPLETLERSGVLRSFQAMIDFAPGRVLGVVPVKLPAHQIDNLRRSARDTVEAFDNFESLLEREVNPATSSLVRSFGEEDLHHQALVILMKPRPLRLAGFAPVVIVP